MVLGHRGRLVCRRAVELVTDYLEGALNGPDRDRFEDHLRLCPPCRVYLAQMKATIAALGRVEPEALAPEARRPLVALYRRWQSG